MAQQLTMGMKCVQYMLFIVNFMFVVVGTLLLTMASTILVAYREFETFIESHYFKPAEMLIAVGVLIILVSFFGGIAAIKQSTLLVNLYALFLLFLVILEVVAAITAFLMQDSIRINIEDNMAQNILTYSTSNSSKSSWDYTQGRLHCCGIHHPNNWAIVRVDGPEINYQRFNYTVPYSCCLDWRCKEVKNWGCSDVLNSYVTDIALIIVYIVVAVEIAQILGLVFACMLAKTIRQVKTQEEMERQQLRRQIYNEVIGEAEQRAKSVRPVILGTPSSTEA